MTKVINSIFTVVRPAIKYNRRVSYAINSQLGVKQGDPSSSLLFMMFVNDILSNINSNLEGIFTVEEVELLRLAYADDQVYFLHHLRLSSLC